jgi:hypothetical protein
VAGIVCSDDSAIPDAMVGILVHWTLGEIMKHTKKTEHTIELSITNGGELSEELINVIRCD